MKERYPALTNKKILISENRHYIRKEIEEWENSGIEIDCRLILPVAEISDIEDTKFFDYAIIHPCHLGEEDYIYTIANHGIPLVVVIKEYPIDQEYGDMYDRIKAKGIPTVIKGEGCYIEAMNILEAEIS